MNTQLSFATAAHPKHRATRADFSPVRAVRTTQNDKDTVVADAPTVTGRATNVRIPGEIRLGIELAPYTPSPTKVWPAWHRGALDRLQMPLTRYRE